MKKLSLVLLSALLVAGTAYAGGSIFGHKHKRSNPYGVYAINVHVCSDLKCPSVRIIEGSCVGEHMGKRYGVCVCDKGYVANGATCEVCPDGQYSDGINACQNCSEGQYIAHVGDTECSDCPSEHYCRDGQAFECPDYAICLDKDFECNEGFTKTTTACVCLTDKYIDGGVCKGCPEAPSCEDNTCCELNGPLDVCGHATAQNKTDGSDCMIDDKAGTCTDGVCVEKLTCSDIGNCCATVSVGPCQKCIPTTGEVVDKVMGDVCDSDGDGENEGSCGPYTMTGATCGNSDDCSSGQECMLGYCVQPVETLQCLPVSCSIIGTCCIAYNESYLAQLAEQLMTEYKNSGSRSGMQALADQANIAECVKYCDSTTNEIERKEDGEPCFHSDVDYYIENQDFIRGNCQNGRCINPNKGCGDSILLPCQKCINGVIVDKADYEFCDANGDGVEGDGTCSSYTLSSVTCEYDWNCPEDQKCFLGFCSTPSNEVTCVPKTCSETDFCWDACYGSNVFEKYEIAVENGDYTKALSFADKLNLEQCSDCNTDTGEYTPWEWDEGRICRYYTGTSLQEKLGNCSNGKCILSPCKGVISWSGECYPCDSTEAIQTDDMYYQCMGNCPERKLVFTDHDGGGLCVLDCAAVGAYELGNNQCEPCNSTYANIPLSAESCVNNCKNTSTPRKMKDGKCVLEDETCPEGTWKSGNGFCHPCDVKQPDDEYLDENPGYWSWYMSSTRQDCQSCINLGYRYFDSDSNYYSYDSQGLCRFLDKSTGECSQNSDCSSGEYCDLRNGLSVGFCGMEVYGGSCKPIGTYSDRIISLNNSQYQNYSRKFRISDEKMNRYSAQNWCLANGMNIMGEGFCCDSGWGGCIDPFNLSYSEPKYCYYDTSYDTLVAAIQDFVRDTKYDWAWTEYWSCSNGATVVQATGPHFGNRSNNSKGYALCY